MEDHDYYSHRFSPLSVSPSYNNDFFYFNLFYSFSFFFLIKRVEVGDCIQANDKQHACPHLNDFHRFPLSPAATVDPLPREYRSMGPKRDPENLGAHVILISSHYLMQIWNYAEFHGFRKVNWIINFFLINGLFFYQQ